MRIFERLRDEHGYTGHDCTVRRFVRVLKAQLNLASKQETYMPGPRASRRPSLLQELVAGGASCALVSTLESCGHGGAKVREARLADGRPDLDVRLVLNFVRTVGNLHELMRSLHQPLANTALTTRDAYAKAVTHQTVVTRMKDASAQAAAKEINSLFEEVLPHELIHRKQAA
jgi:hypothetical protein